MAATHGEERWAGETLDEEAALGLAMTITEYLELFPCPCEALCTCERRRSA